MFGLITHKNLSQENYFSFRQNYCGTCKTIGKLYAHKERLFLNNDVVFLSELLAAIRACENDFKDIKINTCFSLPKKQDSIPDFLKYCASVNVLLAYHKIEDNIKDSRHNLNLFHAIKTIETHSHKKAEKYLTNFGLSTKMIKSQIEIQFLREQRKLYFHDIKDSIKYYSETTGNITGEVFKASASIIGEKHLSDLLFTIGKNYGEVVYLIDVIKDFEKDKSNGNFNIIELQRNNEPINIFEESEQEIFTYVNSNIIAIQTAINSLPIAHKQKITFCTRLNDSISSVTENNITLSNKKCNEKTFVPLKDRLKYAIVVAKNISSKKKWVTIQKMFFYLSASLLVIFFLCFPSSIRAGNSNYLLEANCCNDGDGCCGKCCCDKQPRSDYGEGTKEQCGKFKDTFCTSEFCLSCCAILAIGSFCRCNNSDTTKVVTVTKIVEVDKGCGCK